MADLVAQLIGENASSAILALQRRVSRLTLGHSTSAANARKIRAEGFKGPYTYACVGGGWETLGGTDVLIKGREVSSQVYVDPEELVVEFLHKYRKQTPTPLSMEALARRFGLAQVLNDLESFMSDPATRKQYFDDMTDPENWNLVIVGPIPPTAIRSTSRRSGSW